MDSINESVVRNFYENHTIFITGATGFMGKILIEKILRTCPGVKKIFVLARPKKGKELSQRFKEQFADVIYEPLRKEQPNFTSKLVYIKGDAGLLKLGMSDEDYELVCKEVNVIFHMAATVRFDEKMELAIKTNVRGTREMILMARSCSDLKTFLYVSTAFSNCVTHQIEEKFYDPPISPDELIKLCENLDEDALLKMTPVLLGGFPNTYAYSKMVAEDVVRNMAKGLPISVIRPSIIISTAEEPIKGWIDNVYGPTGVVAGAGLGLLHTLYCDSEQIADLIPVDYVINACLFIAYETAKSHGTLKHTKQNGVPPLVNNIDNEIPIYNYVSSNKKPINWGQFMSYNAKYGMCIPTLLMIWIYSFRLNKNYFIHMYYVIFTHLVPAYIYDACAFCLGKKPQMVKAYQKIHKFTKVITYFTLQRWYFKTENVDNLCKLISPIDKHLFNFDVSQLDWSEYFYFYMRGLRAYLVKDPWDTLESAKKKYSYYQWAHNILLTIVYLSVMKLFGMLIMVFV